VKGLSAGCEERTAWSLERDRKKTIGGEEEGKGEGESRSPKSLTPVVEF